MNSKNKVQPVNFTKLKIDPSVFPELETDFREVVLRIQEMRFAFGYNDIDHFCVQVKDYLNVLLKREKSRLEYRAASEYRCYRMSIIRFVMKLSELEGYTRATLHLSMYIYDRFSDFHTIPLDQVYIVVLACVIIAGKIEERDTKTPKITKLARYLTPACNFSFAKFKEIEIRILQYLNWKVLLPTAYTFMEFYLLFALDIYDTMQSFPPLQKNSPPAQLTIDEITFSARNVTAIRSFAIDVLDTLLYDEPNDKFPPSLVAAGSLMFARRMHGYNGWSDHLAFATGYAKPVVLNCCQEFIEKVYKTHFQNT